jgi:hypothetical protein
LSEELKTYLLLTVIIIILIFKYFFKCLNQTSQKANSLSTFFQLIPTDKTDNGLGLREFFYRTGREFMKYLAKHLRTNLSSVKKLLLNILKGGGMSFCVKTIHLLVY